MIQIKWAHYAYPFEQTPAEKWKTVFYTSIFLSMILVSLQPFGFILSERIELFVGFGIIGFSVLITNYFGLPYLFPKLFDDNNWSVMKAFLFLCYNFLIMGLWNHVYTNLYVRQDLLSLVSGLEITMSLSKMLLIGVLAAGLMILFRYNLLTRRHLEYAQDLNHKLQSKLYSYIPAQQKERIQITLEGKTIDILREDILYISSEGNYLGFHFKSLPNHPPKLYRGRIKNVSEILDNYPELFRSHRSYIINLKYIESTHGNSQGLSISLSGISDKLPVSRPNIKDLRVKMAQLRTGVGRSSQK